MQHLGGRVTEKVVFGDQEITTGASSDLQQVTNVATSNGNPLWNVEYWANCIRRIIIVNQIFLGGDNEAITDRIDT